MPSAVLPKGPLSTSCNQRRLTALPAPIPCHLGDRSAPMHGRLALVAQSLVGASPGSHTAPSLYLGAMCQPVCWTNSSEGGRGMEGRVCF